MTGARPTTLETIVQVMQPVEVWLFGSREEVRTRKDGNYDVLTVDFGP